MLKNLDLSKIVFLDIETVPLVYRYKELPDLSRKFWDKKADNLRRKEEDTAELLYNRAGIYAEFAKVICISVGLYKEGQFLMKSYYGDDEKVLLTEFGAFLNRLNPKLFYLCGHNGKEFDFPFLGRRMIINSLALPAMLDFQGKKPWELPYLDTLELWKFGDYKNYISLDLLTYILNIPSPKGDIEGSDVARVYYEERDLSRIEEYCRRDVVALARVMCHFMEKLPFEDEDIAVMHEA